MENTSRKTEREKIQKHLLISMGAFAFAKVVWAIFFMLFESNTLVNLLLHLTTKTGLIVATFSKFLDVFKPIILKVHTFWRWNHHNIKLQTH